MGCMVCKGEQVALPQGCSQHYDLILLCLFPRLKVGADERIFPSPRTVLPVGWSITTGGYGLDKNESITNPQSMSFPLPGGCKVAMRHEAKRERSKDGEQWLQRLPAQLLDLWQERSGCWGSPHTLQSHQPCAKYNFPQKTERETFLVARFQKQANKQKRQAESPAEVCCIFVTVSPCPSWQPAVLGLAPNGQQSMQSTERQEHCTLSFACRGGAAHLLLLTISSWRSVINLNATRNPNETWWDPWYHAWIGAGDPCHVCSRTVLSPGEKAKKLFNKQRTLTAAGEEPKKLKSTISMGREQREK